MAGEEVQQKEPKLCQESDSGNDYQLPEENTADLYRCGQKQVPVFVLIFKPPQVTAVDGNQRRKEKVRVKKGHLGPQGVPFAFKEPQIV